MNDVSHEIISLLRENNAMWCEIRSMLSALMDENGEYSRNQDMRSFSINVAADMFVKLMEGDDTFRNSMKSYFTKK